MSLENCPNSSALSLENSPNSDSKDFFLSLENSPNSESKGKIIGFFSKNAFGKFSRISLKKNWVWRILQTQVQNLQTHVFFKIFELKGWVWRILQTQVQNLQTHLFLKKWTGEKNKLRGSEVLKISNVQVQTHFLLKTMDTKKKLRDWDWVPFGFKKS